MTIPLPQRELEAAKDALMANEPISFYLSVGDREIGDEIYEGTWGSDGDGAISCDLDVAVRLHKGADDAPSVLGVAAGDVFVPQMVGFVSLPSVNEDTATTNFLAASAKADAGRFPLDEFVEYPGLAPEDVARDCFRRLPYVRDYNRVEPLKTPLLYWDSAHGAAFAPWEFVGQVMGRLEEQTPYRIRDNALGGGVAASVPKVDAPMDPYRTFDGADFGAGDTGRWRPPARAEKRYSEVVVYATDGAGGFAFEPQRARVPYPNSVIAPPEGAKLPIELDDVSGDAPERALQLARDTARTLARGVFQEADGVMLPRFDPLVEIGDPLWVFDEWEDIDGWHDRLWICWVDAYEHDKPTLTTRLTYAAALLRDDGLDAPDLAMAGLSGGAALARLGPCEEMGDILRLDEDWLDWVLIESDLVAIGEDAPEVAISGDLATITCPDASLFQHGEDPFGNVLLREDLSWLRAGAGSAGAEVFVDAAASGGIAYEDGDDVIVDFPERQLPLWGEIAPYRVRFDDSVSWTQQSGEELVTIDATSSGGYAAESGDVVVIQDAP